MKDDPKKPEAGLTREDLEKLRAPFPEDKVCVKVQSFNANKTRALLVPYLQHIDVTERIEQVDPLWESQITHAPYWHQEYCSVQMRLTIKGVSRENSGEGQDSKAATSDALKRCAMSFGIGRYLYESEHVWVAYDKDNDWNREWTLADYRRGLKSGQVGVALPDESSPRERKSIFGRGERVQESKEASRPSQGYRPAARKSVYPKTTADLYAEIETVGKQLRLSSQEAREWSVNEFGVPVDELNIPQLELFLGQLRSELLKTGRSA